MKSQRWRKWYVPSLLVAAMWLAVACSESNSSSGGQGHGPDAAADVGMPDALADASPWDGPACPLLGQSSCVSPFAPHGTPASSADTFDEALSYACAHPVPATSLDPPSYPCVFSCGGSLAIYQYTGVDTANVELFDPSTKQLVEVGFMAGDPKVACSCSASGVAADCVLTGFACGPCTDAGADAPDAGTCPPLYGPILTFDQEAAHLSTNPRGVANWSLACGSMECDGLLAIVDTHGADAQDLYLFDPTTLELVETLSGNDGFLQCTGSATGIDLTASPAFSACRPAPYAPYGTGGFDFQGGGCVDGGSLDASSE